MTTSGTVTFSVNRDQIIKQAMLNNGALGEGEVPTAQETVDCAFLLNLIVKQFSGQTDGSKGLKMWSRKRADLFLYTTQSQYALGPSGDKWATSFTSSTTTAAAAINASAIVVASATGFAATQNVGVVMTNGNMFWTTISSMAGTTVNLGANLTASVASGALVYTYTTANQARRPVSIVTAVLRDQFNNDVPLNFMDVQTYEALPSKANSTAQGDPSDIYYEAQLTNGQLYLDVFPQDVTKHIHMVYLSPPEDFNAATDTPDYSQEWYLALVWLLAIESAPMFGQPITPDMQKMAGGALQIAQNANPETSSLYFQAYDEDMQ